jgi:membrane associated rhomboid family serine protease
METTTCFRHTDRETGRACTRCGRPACPDCLIQASVGSQCFECVRAGGPSRVQRAGQVFGRQRPVVTTTIIAITIAAWVAMSFYDTTITRFEPTAAQDYAVRAFEIQNGEWWRLFTNALVHYGPIHLAFNMFVLYQVGILLEPATGKFRFLLLYLVSVLGGAVGALLLDPAAFTGGASGGVFGLAAAATLVLHRQGATFRETGFGPLLVINLAFSFVVPNISIGGHIGGLLAGLIATELMLQARRVGQPRLAIPAVIAVGVALFAIGLTVAESWTPTIS